MHEIGVLRNIQKVVEKHAETNNVKKVTSITVGAGELSGLVEELLQHAFGYLSRGTITEGAKLIVEIDPVVMDCEKCRKDFKLPEAKIDEAACPKCGTTESLKLVYGKEIYVKHMEVI
jgi:hydrogenase nickel incorporation protein HypA/HybF